MYKRTALHSVLIYVEYLRFNYVDAARQRGWHDTHICHALLLGILLYGFTFLLCISFKFKLLFNLTSDISVVCYIVPCIHRVTIHFALEPSFWAADSLETTHRLLIQLFFFSVEMIIKILLYNSEFLIKRKSFSVSLISSKKLDYIFSKHNVSTCML